MAAIEKAISEDASCSTVLHQVAGVRGAVNGLMDGLIEDHLREHVAHPKLSATARAAGAEELLTAIRRYAK
jgi:DNA-binding FrmR family transcriptional regulator